jgi:16S rRNA (adenine1518-N6/adenine1519-N6)-dimethyltransferase
MCENLREKTQYLLNKFHIKPNKRLGQNFLISNSIIKKIIEIAEITQDDTVFEIGTGLGVVTAALANKAKEVIACEVDKRLMNILYEELKVYSNVRYIQQDILKLNLRDIIGERKVKVVANLPYSITTPVITFLLEKKELFSVLVLMVQHEVAERILASPGTKEYGAFSIFVNYHALVEKKLYVPKTCFLPQPQVDSEILKIYPRSSPCVKVKDENLFFNIYRVAFNQRRKTLKNALSSISILCKPQIEYALQAAGITSFQRGETLSMQEFARLADVMYDLIQNKK